MCYELPRANQRGYGHTEGGHLPANERLRLRCRLERRADRAVGTVGRCGRCHAIASAAHTVKADSRVRRSGVGHGASARRRGGDRKHFDGKLLSLRPELRNLDR